MNIILERTDDDTNGLQGDGFRVIAKTPGMAVDALVNILAYWETLEEDDDDDES